MQSESASASVPGTDKPRPRKRYSASVDTAVQHFTSGQVSAVELAADILRDHSYYGAKRGGEVAKQLYSLDSHKTMQILPAAAWVERVAALFKPDVRISGRCVVIGLAMLDNVALEELLHGGFLVALANEADPGHDSVATRLIESARKTLENLLANSSALSGSTETLSDAPATQDQLGRLAFAGVLADRIRRLRDTEKDAPLVVHLDGPWGSGKSTLLNFLESELTEPKASGARPWLVIRYNAWQQQRFDSPWWTITTQLAVEGSRQLRRERAWPRAMMVGLQQFWFRTFAGRMAVLLAAFAAICIGWLLLYRTDAASTKLITGVKDTLSVATIVFGMVLAATRFLIARDESSQEYLKSRPDPLGELVRHVARLVSLLRRPVAVLVDDMDRCEAPAVIRLLEGIHTVFGSLPLTFVAAGDGRWIARAFEKTYADAAPRYTNSASLGRPVGTLFLEKLFQFSAVVPDMPEALRSQFWRSLLKKQAGTQDSGGDASAKIAKLDTEEDILAEVAAVDPRIEPARAQALREAAMRRLSEPDLIEKPSRHVRELFEELVESNPRAMKRQIMAYGMARASDLASFRNTPQPLLATWSVLCLRWPLLADWLRDDPDRLSLIDLDSAASTNIPEADQPFLALMRKSDVHRLLAGPGAPDHIRLDAAALRRMTGQAE